MLRSPSLVLALNIIYNSLFLCFFFVFFLCFFFVLFFCFVFCFWGGGGGGGGLFNVVVCEFCLQNSWCVFMHTILLLICIHRQCVYA